MVVHIVIFRKNKVKTFVVICNFIRTSYEIHMILTMHTFAHLEPVSRSPCALLKLDSSYVVFSDSVHYVTTEQPVTSASFRMKMESPDQTVPSRTIVEPSSLSLTIKRALSPVNSDLTFDLSGRLKIVTVSTIQQSQVCGDNWFWSAIVQN